MVLLYRKWNYNIENKNGLFRIFSFSFHPYIQLTCLIYQQGFFSLTCMHQDIYSKIPWKYWVQIALSMQSWKPFQKSYLEVSKNYEPRCISIGSSIRCTLLSFELITAAMWRCRTIALGCPWEVAGITIPLSHGVTTAMRISPPQHKYNRRSVSSAHSRSSTRLSLCTEPSSVWQQRSTWNPCRRQWHIIWWGLYYWSSRKRCPDLSQWEKVLLLSSK
jgi:hypothetical protein